MNIANKLTLLRIALIPVFVVFFYLGSGYWNYYVAALIFIGASVTDLFDGLLARKYNIVTNFGKLMDPIADKLLVCTALILLAVCPGTGGVPYRIHPVLVTILIGREFIISGFRTLAAAEGKVIAADKLGKLKTVVQIVMIVTLLLWNGIFGDWIVIFGIVLIWASVVLSVVSCVDYFLKNKDIVKSFF
jgi:CDP-diacylglycerol---glycerol-3-phosphate 3-phosphatidyltransferase